MKSFAISIIALMLLHVIRCNEVTSENYQKKRGIDTGPTGYSNSDKYSNKLSSDGLGNYATNSHNILDHALNSISNRYATGPIPENHSSLSSNIRSIAEETDSISNDFMHIYGGHISVPSNFGSYPDGYASTSNGITLNQLEQAVRSSGGYGEKLIGNIADRLGSNVRTNMGGQKAGPTVTTLTRTISVPVPAPYPVTITRPVTVPVPQHDTVLIPKPVPVTVPVPSPVIVPGPVPVTVTRTVPVPVQVPVRVPIPQPETAPGAQLYPVTIGQPGRVRMPHTIFIPVAQPMFLGGGLNNLVRMFASYGNIPSGFGDISGSYQINRFGIGQRLIEPANSGYASSSR